jgi:hypothetical protein
VCFSERPVSPSEAQGSRKGEAGLLTRVGGSASTQEEHLFGGTQASP